jgi:nucleoside-diphosphate-sugar epimerase
VVKDPLKDLVEPAVHGTENVLSTANKTPSVKRVVVTSSMASLCTDASETSKERPLTEEVWNRTASLDHMPYYLSKTSAEQKSWTIAGSQTQWKLCTINPGVVLGPGLKYHESSESFKIFKSLGSNDPNMAFGAPDLCFSIVDVREVAAAHIAAAYLEDASGRYILAGHSTSFPGLAQATAKKYSPEYPIVTSSLPYFLWPLIWLLAPYTGQGLDRLFILNNFSCKFYFENSKSKEELGIEYRSLEETCQEMYKLLIDNDVVTPVK